MKVIQLIKHGDDPSCFSIREKEKPSPKQHEVLIKVKAFGLNYADVMARKGLYRDAPPLPSVLGYDVVGTIEAVGEGTDKALLGKEVAAVTEFGGYAEYAVTNEAAAVVLPFSMEPHAAVALATQYATAHYAALRAANIQPGEKVFIHAAAGGVGLALIQFCKLKNCIIYGTVSNGIKESLLRELGVQHVINSSKQDVLEDLIKLENQVDVVFDSVGGKNVKLGIRALRAGGRIVCYGGSQLAAGKGIFHKVGFALSFGFYSPIGFLAQSKSLLGINMLRLIRANPSIIKSTLDDTAILLRDKSIATPIGRTFPVSEIFQAHQHLQNRESIGKIAVAWN